MPRVLIIAWYFPPVGGPGVQRTLKYCKYLPREGWEITVIGGIDPGEHQDPALAAEIPPGIILHRLGRPDTRWRRLRTWLFAHRLGPIGLGRFGHWIGLVKDFPDTMREWADTVVELAVEEHRRQPFDVIYTSSYPYSVHFAGGALKQRLGLPWVADLRDPWVENELMLEHLPRWVRARHARAERRMVESCDALVCAHPGHAERLRERYRLSPSRCLAITNGYDPEDYLNFPDPPPLGPDGVVRLVHTGSFYGAYSPIPLLRALTQGWRPLPAGIQTLEVRLVGGDGDVIFPDLPGLRVVVRPRVSHAEALQEQAGAHLLLCVFDRSFLKSLLPGKLFEYMACKRPIVAVVPSGGSTAELIRTTTTGWVADCDRPEEIIAALQASMADLLGYGRGFSPDRHAIARYSRPELARQLSAVLSGVTNVSLDSLSMDSGGAAR
ncbi:MAG: glycosyltransferase [Chromatiaceae bacterium]